MVQSSSVVPSRAGGLPWGAHLPGISIELALDPGEAVHFINLQRGARYVLAGLDYDDHVVIPVYVALLVVLGIWLLGRNVPSARVLGVLVIAAALCVEITRLK